MPDLHPPAPWEREPAESARAYAAFLIYKDLGPDKRSIDNAYQVYWHNPERVAQRLQKSHKGAPAPKPPQGAPGTWNRWAAAHGWVGRALAWDDHVNRLTEQKVQRELVKKRADTRTRMLTASELGYVTSMRFLNELAQNPESVANLSPTEAMNILKVSTDLALRALNMEQPQASQRSPFREDEPQTTPGESTGGGKPPRRTADDDILDELTASPDLIRMVQDFALSLARHTGDPGSDAG